MSVIGAFPFGQPVCVLEQQDRAAKEVFVLGVYASAVHARWVGPDGSERAKALAVASEPYIFWRGENAGSIIGKIRIPPEAGRLEPAAAMFNGPSGIALDDLFLAPLRRTREHAWLADLVPHSCVNPQQSAALERAYHPHASTWALPLPTVPAVPSKLATTTRQNSIAEELLASRARTLVLLGDEPIRWFSSRWLPSRKRLADFGATTATYGRPVDATIAGHDVAILALAHPRQVARLGRSSQRWYDLHQHWVESVAATILPH